MQGKLIIAVTLAAFGADAALCGETVKRMLPCNRAAEQVQQQRQPRVSQQPPQQARRQSQGCTIVRPIPPVVDQTPMFLL